MLSSALSSLCSYADGPGIPLSETICLCLCGGVARLRIQFWVGGWGWINTHPFLPAHECSLVRGVFWDRLCLNNVQTWNWKLYSFSRIGVWQVLECLLWFALWLHFLQENCFSIMQKRTARVPTNQGRNVVMVTWFSKYPQAVSLSGAILLSPHLNANIC